MASSAVAVVGRPFIEYQLVLIDRGATVAKAISKVGGPRAVALAAVKFLSFGSLRQIATAEVFLPDDLANAVAWLVGGGYQAWQQYLARGGRVAIFAVAAAVRMRKQDERPLERAMARADEAVADAARYVARFRPLPSEAHDVLQRVSDSRDARTGPS